MPLKIITIEREDELLGIRFRSHFGDVFNIMIDFKRRLVWYKDGHTFNGQWQWLTKVIEGGKTDGLGILPRMDESSRKDTLGNTTGHRNNPLATVGGTGQEQ